MHHLLRQTTSRRAVQRCVLRPVRRPLLRQHQHHGQHDDVQQTYHHHQRPTDIASTTCTAATTTRPIGVTSSSLLPADYGDRNGIPDSGSIVIARSKWHHYYEHFCYHHHHDYPIPPTHLRRSTRQASPSLFPSFQNDTYYRCFTSSSILSSSIVDIPDDDDVTEFQNPSSESENVLLASVSSSSSSLRDKPQTKKKTKSSSSSKKKEVKYQRRKRLSPSSTNIPNVKKSQKDDDASISEDPSESEDSVGSAASSVRGEPQTKKNTKSSNSSSSSKTKEVKYKRRKRKPLQQQQQTSLSQKTPNADDDDPVVRQQLEKLFDDIAPHVTINKLESYVASLERATYKNTTPQQRKKWIDRSAKRVAAAAAELDDKKNGSDDNNNEDDDDDDDDEGVVLRAAGADPKTWMHAKILSFLDILPLHARPVQTMVSPADEHRKTLPHTTKILRKAREKSVETTGMSWSDTQQHRSNKKIFLDPKKEAATRKKWHKAKSRATLQQEAQEFAQILAQRLPSQKYTRVVRFFESYVQEQQQPQQRKSTTGGKETTKADNPGGNDDDDAAAVGDDDSVVAKTSTKASWRQGNKGGIRLLFRNVELKLGGHVHLIAPDLAKFFYFDPPAAATATATATSTAKKGNGKDNDAMKEKKAAESIAYREQKVIESKMKWEKYKERFVTKMLALYRQIRVEEKDDAEEELAEIAIANLKIEEAPLLDDQTEKPQHVPPSHLIFDAVVVDDYRERDKVYPLSSETTVFVDNLPIDITKDEVVALYSRCGPLESIEIFNQRLDLDPGPHTPATLRKMAQQKRKQLARWNQQQAQTGREGFGGSRWTRPRTPVYAMLNFGNEEAMQIASQDALRIFGMIVRGHSVRSVRAKDLTRLYIDNICGTPSKKKGAEHYRSAMDIEFSLSQLLNPDLYVSLDLSNSKRGKRAVPTSCEIMFPSFEVAFDAFCKLRENLDFVKDDELCTINWLRTPPDAMLYWKRELGGVV